MFERSQIDFEHPISLEKNFRFVEGWQILTIKVIIGRDHSICQTVTIRSKHCLWTGPVWLGAGVKKLPKCFQKLPK